MKKLIFILLFFISLNCYSQKDTTTIRYQYCELVGTSKLLSSKLTIQIDYGQERSIWKGIEAVKDENGKIQSFNSMVDALNYMGTQGWEFVQAYVVTVSSNQNVYHWLLKKKI